jgi:outer membrane protein OmpA-like peptidoglycan-associated protein
MRSSQKINFEAQSFPMKLPLFLLSILLSLDVFAQTEIVPVTDQFQHVESAYFNVEDGRLVFRGSPDHAMKVVLPLTFSGEQNEITYKLKFRDRDMNYWGGFIYYFSTGEMVYVNHTLDQTLSINYYADATASPKEIRPWSLAENRKVGFNMKIQIDGKSFSVYVNDHLENSFKTRGGELQKMVSYTKADPQQLWMVERMTATNVCFDEVPKLDLSLTQEPKKIEAASEFNSSDLNPMITSDGSTIFFTRVVDGYNKAMQCLKQEDGSWSKAKQLPNPVNMKKHNVSIASPGVDGSSFYVTGYRYEYGSHPRIEGVSKTRLTEKGYGDFTSFSIDAYENEGKTRSYYLSADQEFLILAIEGDVTYGQKDIYVSFLRSDPKDGNYYSHPLNLGSVINTSANEVFGFLAADNATLYFSSSGHHGYGDNDFFMTKRLDDSWTNWSDPINMGPIINSTGWDGHFSTDATGQMALISTKRKGDVSSEIYQVSLLEETMPDPVLMVTGRVLNKETNKPVKAEIMFRALSEGAVSKSVNTNVRTGEYKVVFNKGASYEILANLDGFYPISDVLRLDSVTSFDGITKDLFLTEIKKGEAIRLNNIFFETGSATLQAESYNEIDRLAKLIEGKKKIVIQISGHSDNVGSESFNLKLSGERANAVMEYLIEQGISADRVSAKGFGPSVPVSANDTEAGKALNRRVEFTILE